MIRPVFTRAGGRLAAAVVLGLVFALLPASVAADDGDELARAIRIQERMSARLMATPGVVGTGVAINGGGQPTIRVYTTTAAVDGLPSRAGGVAVQRVVTGLVLARACQDTGDPTERCNRPVPIGVSVGHPDVTAGTIGARVTDGSAVFALSNNHVLADSNAASIGDPALQPGSADGGTDPADRIGTLAAFEPITFAYSDCTEGEGDPDCNTIDAAIAATTTDNVGTATLGGYGTPSSTIATASVGQSVTKCGRTTGCTTGSVAEVNVTIDVCYKPRGPFFCASDGVARFVNQIGIRDGSDGSFSAGGDSGSLIVSSTGANPVGLLFAGGSTRTFANEIGRVLTRFSVTVDSTADTSPPPPPPPDDATAPASLTASVTTKGTTRVDLAWSGGGATVDVLRDDPDSASFVTIATISNGGSYRDNVGKRPSAGTYTYRICNAGTTACSNDASVEL